MKSALLSSSLALFFAGPLLADTPQTGLWIGTVRLDKVSESSQALTPAASVFEFRIILHVDAAGDVRLLKDVIIMQRDHDGKANTAPQIVLVTDPAKIPLFSGLTRRDGQLAGIRHSATAYHFTGTELAAPGALAPGKSVTYTLESGENDPENPFRHKFHPDHSKGRAVTRKVTVNLAGSSLTDAPGYGVKRISGTYKESIEKLVNRTIEMAGSVTLDRISAVAVLNQ